MPEALSIPIVTLHLIAADLAAVGPLVCLWALWRAARGDRLAAQAERGLLRASIWALLAAMLLGVAGLGLLWWMDRDAWFQAARQIPQQRYWYGLIELGFSLACLAVCLRLAGRDSAAQDSAAGFGGRFKARFILLALAGTNLAYHFPPLFAAIGVLSTRPEGFGTQVRFVAMLADPEVLARTLHHLLAALAVTGAAIMVGGLRWKAASESDARRRVASWGARLALAAVAGQLLAGLHLLFQLSSGARQRLMGEDALASLLFAAALLITIMLLHRLAAIAFGDAEPRQIVISAVLIGLAMLLMVATRHRTRQETSLLPGRPLVVIGGRTVSWCADQTGNCQADLLL